MTESTIISKIWNMANVLRDDGVSYGDYLEQITYLLFLKMADEMNKPPYNKGLKFPHLKDAEGKEIPNGELCDWETLTSKRGAELEAYYVQMLRSLATEKGMLGQIYTKSLTDLDNLPEPDEIAAEIIDNLEEGIANFRKVLEMCVDTSSFATASSRP